MVDRATNKHIIYPVGDRSENTLLKIIKKHVDPGSVIYSDGWPAYIKLNDHGYQHFSVIHKNILQTGIFNKNLFKNKNLCKIHINIIYKCGACSLI